MPDRSTDRSPAGRPPAPRPEGRPFTRRIDCAETPRPPRVEEEHGRGRGNPDPEAWARAHPMVH